MRLQTSVMGPWRLSDIVIFPGPMVGFDPTVIEMQNSKLSRNFEKTLLHLYLVAMSGNFALTCECFKLNQE